MRSALALGVVLVLFAAPAFGGVGEGSPGELKVGFSQLDITPPVGAIMTGPGLGRSVGTDDPLRARTLVVQSGDRTMAIVGVDLVKIRLDLVVPCRDPADQREGAIERLGWRPDAFDAAKREAARMPRTRKVPVNAGRIGPLGIATNAGELFVEWGLFVKKRSPFPHTIMCELTNDWIGYEPTAQAFQHEGYETLAGVNFVSLEGTQTLVDTAVKLLQELWERDNYRTNERGRSASHASELPTIPENCGNKCTTATPDPNIAPSPARRPPEPAQSC